MRLQVMEFSLLTSRIFIALHHSHSYSLANQESYFLPELHALHHPDPDESHLRRHLTYLRPLNRSYRQLNVVGLASNDNFIIFWNPITRKYISVQNPGGLDLGFGFDAANNDFKVVTTALPRYGVFSVNASSWRESVADSVKGYTTRPGSGACFANGTIHWIAMANLNIDLSNRYALTKITYTFALLLFDCEREQFETMELPQRLLPNGQYEFMLVQLFTYSGMLSALKEVSWGRSRGCYEVWVMEEYGAESTWKRLFNIDERPWARMQVVILEEDGVISR